MNALKKYSRATICIACLVALVCDDSCWAQNDSKPNTFNSIVRPFFNEYCDHCHGADTQEGELRLDTLRPDFLGRPAADHWIEVLDRINLGEMPPEDEAIPSEAELARVTDWITTQITAARRHSNSTGGKVVLRRLTRLEYANTVRDLLHVSFVDGEGPIDLLPPDGSIQGFDRNSKALLVDPSLMSAYLDVAQKVADQAVRFRPPLVPERTVRFEFRDMIGSPMNYQLEERSGYLDGTTVVMMQGAARGFAELRHPFSGNTVPKTGRYRVRVQAAADPGDRGEPVFMRVRQGPGDSIAQFRVDARPGKPEVYEFETIRDEQFGGEYQVGIVNGTEFTRYVGSRGQQNRKADDLLKEGGAKQSLRLKARLRAQGDSSANAFRDEVLSLDGLPKLHLDWIEVTGPLQEDYPPKSMRTIFYNGWEQEKLNVDYARHIFARLLPRTYRRRVTKQEVDEITQLVESELGRGNDFPTAIKTGIVAMLCSPKFLYLYEPVSNAQTPRQLNNFELASRLSYLLWSSKPDDELFRSALNGHLSRTTELLAQVDRMLDDPRSDGFIDGFVRQWLKIDEFNRFPPDQQIFPDYYATELAGLEGDLLEQPLATIRELLGNDGSLADLLDSDWVMVNERLSNYYNIGNVTGNDFQRVSLKNSQSSNDQPPPAAIRGGLLGMAGIHMWGSDGSRTKPVERGKYILDVLFNDPPPPPPPNAGEVEPNIRGEKLTVRERLARHREQTTCMNCHRRIDPYGLALENFNVIGQWRNNLDGEKPLRQWGDDRPTIDIGGTLPSGQQYESFIEFKQALLLQEDRFLRGLTEKMLMYALARTIAPSDRPTIDHAVQVTKNEGKTLRSLIKQIVLSETFRQK